MSSCMVALNLGVDFNYSHMIYKDMHYKNKGKQKELFLAFPRFIQIIINRRHQNLVPAVGMLFQKRITFDIFSYMVMNKNGKKVYAENRLWEVRPIKVDLLQSCVFNLKQDSVKKDQEIKNLRPDKKDDYNDDKADDDDEGGDKDKYQNKDKKDEYFRRPQYL
ncbi:hypothetical protein R6Q57_003408 [Mikania cordata]